MSVRITADRASVIDEAGELADELAAEDATHAARTSVRRARVAALQAEILGWYENEPPESKHAPAGEKYLAEIGPRGNRSSIISIQAVARRLGRKVFLEHAEIALGTLRGLLGKTEIEEFIRTERSGNRSLTLVRKSG